MQNKQKKITDVYIRSPVPKDAQYEVSDPLVANFHIRVSPKGTKSFGLYYRVRGKRKRLVFGQFSQLSLKNARELARIAQRDIAEGRDPLAEKHRDREQRVSNEFSAVVSMYIENHAKVFTRTWPETQRVLNNAFVLRWGSVSLHDIDKGMVIKRLREIRVEHGPSASNHAFSYIRAFFNWCLAHDEIAYSPCSGLRRPAMVQSRERVLSDDELRAVWSASNVLGYPFGPFVQLLVLTGQRLSEVANLRWNDLDIGERIWTQVSNKSDSVHIVPLALPVIQILQGLPKLHVEFVFPARGSSNRPISGFSKWKKELDKEAGVRDWWLHDLRRTSATKMAQLGVEPHVTEHVLNHSSQMLRGVAGVYNRYSYVKEKRQALELWCDHVNREVLSSQMWSVQ